MKIAISSKGRSLDSFIDERFGRCDFVIIAQVENGKIIDFNSFENDSKNQDHGAGINLISKLSDLGVDVIITGKVGPNVDMVLKELNILLFSYQGIVNKGITKFLKHDLNDLKNDSKDTFIEKYSYDLKIEKKILFPILDNNGFNSKISEHFGHAQFFGVFDGVKNELEIISNSLNHSDANKSPIDQIEEDINPDVIFAKGIGQKAINIIKQKGMLLKTGEYNTIIEVLNNYNKLNDQIDDCGHKD